MPRRGDIYFVDLHPAQGREHRGRRPVLVVSADAIDRQPLVVTVVVGTDARNITRDYPTNVRLRAEQTGLPLDTVFMCFQIRSLDRQRFIDPKTRRVQRAGSVSPDEMKRVDEALRLTLAL